MPAARRHLAGAVLAGAALLAAGCGGGDEEGAAATVTQTVTVTTPAATEPAAETTTATAPAAAETATTEANPAAPAGAEARRFARTLLPGVRKELRKQGVDEIGDQMVTCGSRGTCTLTLEFRRGEECGRFELEVTLATGADGPHVEDQTQDTVPQICYIGRDGEPVPSRP